MKNCRLGISNCFGVYMDDCITITILDLIYFKQLKFLRKFFFNFHYAKFQLKSFFKEFSGEIWDKKELLINI